MVSGYLYTSSLHKHRRELRTERFSLLYPGFLFILASLASPAISAQAADNHEGTRPPNIVFILSDDEDVGSHPVMKHTRELITEQGTRFTNAFVTFPLCCPSRASILRGQYPHNTGVQGNRAPRGGFAAFRRLGREESTIGTWLQDAGYHTGFYGKYLNGYSQYDTPPPGWSEWHVGNVDAYKNFNYALNENGKAVNYGDAAEDYLTDVLARKASEHIRRWAVGGKPFFLYVAPFNPHRPFVPAPRHVGLFKDAVLPKPASFNERDVSDKPRSVQALPPLSETDLQDIERIYRLRLETMLSNDELVETLVNTLDETGQLDNTYIVFMSDNGFHLGSHRMKAGKDSPYDEDIRVPLVMRGPGMPAGKKNGAIVLNTDLAPTFAAMAGIEPPDFVDGRSLLPLIAGENKGWRKLFLFERIGFESDLRVELQANAIGLRTENMTYVGYENGETELYDLEKDPYQLQSLPSTSRIPLRNALSTRLTLLNACVAEACRRLEDLPLRSLPGETIVYQ